MEHSVSKRNTLYARSREPFLYHTERKQTVMSMIRRPSRTATTYLGLHCLHMSSKTDARLIFVDMCDISF